MSSCKLICKPWYINSPLQWLCCRPDVFLLEHTLFHLDLALVWFWFILCEAAVSVTAACGLQGGNPSLGVPAHREGAAAPRSQPAPPGHWYSRGWRRKARESRLTATGMFTNQGLAVPWRHRSLSPISGILQREDLETKMLALNFKNSR